MSKFLPVASPVFEGNERKYVLDCLESTWISSTGRYLEAFEKNFAEYCGVRHAACCSNGTVALHLALLALGVGPGDEVIVPTLTYIATANSVLYVGATPVFVDSEPGTWNLNVELLDSLVTAKTKAVIAVHLYGHPCDMEAVSEFADRHGLFVIEDAAEAHGATCRGKRAGSLGHVSTFSFYGNKVITTGEGGAVLTDDDDLDSRIRILKGQGQDPKRRYWHPVVGYNYRMTNVQAALGLAQLERIDEYLAKRRRIADWYNRGLGGVPGIQLPVEREWATNIYWLYSVVLEQKLCEGRDRICSMLLDRGIETRPFFYPMHIMPPFQSFCCSQRYPIAEWLGRGGVNLPTWTGLTEADVDRVCQELAGCMEQVR